MTITRRTLLIGGLGGLGLALSGCTPGGVPDVGTGPMVSGTFHSSYRHMDVGWAISYPPGSKDGDRLPVLVTLHGRGGDHTTAFHRSLYLDKYQAQVTNQGVRPFAIASVDGGDHEYWHPRRDGDPAAMVSQEFIPLLGQRGLDVAKVGLLGWSMGGYGALYLASRMGRQRVSAMVAESPAIWHHSWQSVEGAFDDAEDWNKHTIWGQQRALRGIALRIDCGDHGRLRAGDPRPARHAAPDSGRRHRAGQPRFGLLAGQAPAQFRWLAHYL